MTEMAMSGYLLILIAIIIFYPFALVAVQMIFYSDVFKKKYTRYLNWLVLCLFAFSLVMHLQTEVIYGEELLNWLSDQ
ncbi:hypothetical protein BIY22_08875 [Vibrio panuliri]|uniref:NrfF protein n=2 Tax=Vibrio panuliri TaxID=1381081 RepID=A0A1Q9HEW7_9VIBR|nr:hypothetical protein [Vibrio panuliri]KAB1455510.1 hypothetical protein F7O85_16990 [Vibrio panuliri]OLQ84235.1 hypothetical protein BIY20_17865 [Vibrio panuliri]OLQ88267.1 hypothetical protein BIY22_08875 [Vibrio panuliri]